MDDRTFGRLVRAARIRRGWRQVDLETASGIDQTSQSRLEGGRLGGFTLRTLRAAVAPLGLEVRLQAMGVPYSLREPRDAVHARLVEIVATLFRRAGWLVLPEYTFNHFGERGAADLVAWHPDRGALLIVEVKSRIIDIQELLSAFNRKLRIVPMTVRATHGWNPIAVGHVLVVAEGTSQRRMIRAHSTTFASVLPASGRAVRAWLNSPSGHLAGVWFLSPMPAGHGKQPLPGSRRVRRPQSRSDETGERTAATAAGP
jgi:transcriptional regulator with XRE-family HTH domain